MGRIAIRFFSASSLNKLLFILRKKKEVEENRSLTHSLGSVSIERGGI